MPTLDLTAEETALLAEILSSYLSRLRSDIADTDLKDYRDGLKAKEATVKSLIGRFAPTETSP